MEGIIGKHALVLLSGGQDSTTALFWAKKHYEVVSAVTVNYGQSHAIEIESARTVGQMAQVKNHRFVDVPNVLLSASPLTNKDATLETYSDIQEMERIIGSRIEKTFVPMRNFLFLTLAVNYAEHLGCDAVVIGTCLEDAANYPDCTCPFIAKFAIATSAALGSPLPAYHIVTPLIGLTKAQTVALAQDLPGCMEALAHSHTCYAGQNPPCGKCHSCLLRAKGFSEAGVEDPLVPPVLAE